MMSEGNRTAEPPVAAQTRYEFDTRVSRITIRAFAEGVLSVFAHNPTFAVRRFSGHVVFDPAAMSTAETRIVLQTDSFELTDNVSDSDRREIERVMRDKVLEVGRFPTITFESTSVEIVDEGGRYRVAATGPLSLHGVTRDRVISAHASLMGGQLRVFGEWSLDQTDFGIMLVSVAGRSIRVKDELKCTFDLLARRPS
jgi:polyisoprenoid-binding protein YceI